MATALELKEIAKKRLDAASILAKTGDYDTAIYLIGYSVECALKAAVCDTLDLDDYPDMDGSGPMTNTFKTHLLGNLLILSGMSKQFVIPTASKRLFENWSLVSKIWNPAIRYSPVGEKTKAEFDRLMTALVEDPDGVLTVIWRRMKW